jgi:uncharacterized membrane protein
MSETEPQPAPRAQLDQPPPSPAAASVPPPQPATSGFDFNHPTVVSLCYISSVVLGVTAIVGVVLAYVWKGEAHADWETSHYDYLIRTFWIGLIGSVVSVLLMIVLIGFLLLLATFVLVVVRCVLSLVNAQKRMPMPNPDTWLA